MATGTYTWTLSAYQQQGNLWLKWSTTAPFRAQQGQIQVYKGIGFPPIGNQDTERWSWDNENNANWNTGLRWGSDWYCAWIAEKSPNGPYTYVAQLVTTGSSRPESVTCE
jgi:hypothetical protein